jgi:hypothetical protein
MGPGPCAALEGVDTLLNVEKLKFTDKSVTLPSVDHDGDG